MKKAIFRIPKSQNKNFTQEELKERILAGTFEFKYHEDLGSALLRGSYQYLISCEVDKDNLKMYIHNLSEIHEQFNSKEIIKFDPPVTVKLSKEQYEGQFEDGFPTGGPYVIEKEPTEKYSFEDAEEIKILRVAIQRLAEYSKDLPESDPKKATSTKLAGDFTQKLDNFVSVVDNNKNDPVLVFKTYEQFKKDSVALARTGYTQLSGRSEVKVILKNILLAITLIGAVVVAGKALHSYMTKGTAQGFFSKTKGQEKVDQIEDQVNKIFKK